MSPRPRHIARAALAAVVAVLTVLAPISLPSASAGVREEGPIWEGVWFQDRAEPGPVRTVSLHVTADAQARFGTVVSGDRVDGGREVVSGMCHRAGAVACVNAHFSICSRCDQPFGGIIRDGVIVRTPTVLQHQVSVVDGHFSTDPWPWSGGLVVTDVPDAPALELAGINTGPAHDGIVLSTRDYGNNTRAPAGGYEVAITLRDELYTGLDNRQPVQVLGVNADGHTEIPVGGAVLTGLGAGAERLRAFAEAGTGHDLELVTHTPSGLEQSFAGHPVLLRKGQRQAIDPNDGKIRNRHPRTLLGWNDAGDVWVVVVDGRQAHSRGMTLFEATDHMAALGATDAVNLDGGGSSTMVTVCPSPSGWCLRNSPSGGRQRAVTTALAIIPTASTHAGVAGSAAEQGEAVAQEASAEVADDPVPAEGGPDEAAASEAPAPAPTTTTTPPTTVVDTAVEAAETPPPAPVPTAAPAPRLPIETGEVASAPPHRPAGGSVSLNPWFVAAAALSLVGYAVLATHLGRRWLVRSGPSGPPSRTGTGRALRPRGRPLVPNRRGAARR